MRKHRARLLALILLVPLLSGCWDMHDISDRTPVLALGFDRLQSGAWRVTTAQATLAQGGSATYMGALHYGDGPTLSAAIEDLRSHVARGLYFGSAKVFVLGWGVLQSHSTEVLHMLLQREEVDKTGFVIGTRGTALALLAKPDGVMGITSVRLLKGFEVQPQTRDGDVPVQLWQTVWGVLATRETLRVPIFDVLPMTSVAQTGTALISQNRFRTMLDDEESATLRWIANLPGRHVVALDPPMQAYVLKVTRVRTAARYDGSRRHLSLRIAAAAEASTAPTMELKSSLVRALAQSAAETLARRVLQLVRKMQAVDADGAMWYEVAEQAGYFDFDLKRTTVSVQVKVNMLPIFGPAP